MNDIIGIKVDAFTFLFPIGRGSPIPSHLIEKVEEYIPHDLVKLLSIFKVHVAISALSLFVKLPLYFCEVVTVSICLCRTKMVCAKFLILLLGYTQILWMITYT